MLIVGIVAVIGACVSRPMGADITNALRRRRARYAVVLRKTAGTLESLFAKLRERILAEQFRDDDQRPRLH